MEYTRVKTIDYKINKDVPGIGAIDGKVTIHEEPQSQSHIELNQNNEIVVSLPIDYDSIRGAERYIGRIDATFTTPSDI